MYGNNLIKLFKAINFLTRPEGATISQLQKHLNSSRRSIYRLIDTLKDLDFPLSENNNKQSTRKTWKLDENYLTELPNISIKELSLSKEEIILLFFLFSRGSILRHTEIEKFLLSLKEKFDVFLPEKLKSKETMMKLDDIFIPESSKLKDYSVQEDILDDLTDSIVQHKRCIVTYHSYPANRDKIFQIDPLKLFEFTGALYAFVKVVKYESISILAIDRIKKVVVLGITFPFPDVFNPLSILESAFILPFGDAVSVRIWFSSELSKEIKKRKWAEQQSVEENEDGSIILSITTNGVFDVKKWVLSFGASAKVLEPKFLAEKIQDEINKMKKEYQ